MRKTILLAALGFCLAVPMLLSAAPYDKAASQTAMRANVARVQSVKAAVSAGDYFSAAQLFMEYAKEAEDMKKMDPPKGPKEVWIKTWQDFQDAAFRGVGACATKDSAAVLKALDETVAVNKVGHPTFRF